MKNTLKEFQELSIDDQQKFLKKALNVYKQATDPLKIFGLDNEIDEQPKRGRPLGSKNKTQQEQPVKTSGAKRGRKPSADGLASYILRVVRENADAEGLDAPTITNKVIQAGYKTRSKNPVNQVRTYLSDMASDKKGILETVKRGRYVIGSNAPEGNQAVTSPATKDTPTLTVAATPTPTLTAVA